MRILWCSKVLGASNAALKPMIEYVWSICSIKSEDVLEFAKQGACNAALGSRTVLLFQPNYRLIHPETYLFSLSKNLFTGSKHPEHILLNFENRSSDQESDAYGSLTAHKREDVVVCDIFFKLKLLIFWLL